jgi:ATP-dependent DNA helicase UvrD/PcrA
MIPQRFFTHGQHARGDRHVYAARSRFLPDELASLFEKVAWPRIAAEGASSGPRPQLRVDLGARMRGMWR